MSAKSFSSCKRLGQSVLAGAVCTLTFSSCSENESQVMELRLLREKLAAAEKKTAEAVAAAQQAPAPAPAPVVATKPDTESLAKLEAATAKIASLEKELQTARATPPAPVENASAKINADSFREFVKTMERDLLAKTSELQESVEKALPTANIQETTVKRLRLPEQLSTAFQSAVVFNITAANGEPKRLEFPVQAGLDGQWRMPGVADVQQHLTAMATQSQPAAPTVAATPAPAPAPVPSPAPAPSTPAAPANPHTTSALPVAASASIPNIPQPAGMASGPGGPATYVIQWGDAAPAKAPAQPQQAPQQQQPAVKPQPAAPVAATPAPAPAQPKPAQAPAQRPVPRPLMPVQQDIQIRFE